MPVLIAQEPPAQEAPAQKTKEVSADEDKEAKEAPDQPAPAPEAAAQQPPAQDGATPDVRVQETAEQPLAPLPAVKQPQVAEAPPKEPTLYDRVPRKAKLYIEGDETVDASNSKNKAKYGDFTGAIAAALAKKKVPVMVVTDPARADFFVRHTSSHKEDSTGTKIAKIAVLGGLWGSSRFDASIMVIDKASTGVLFSYNVKKGNFQSAAEAFAKHLNNHIEGKE